MSAAVAFTVSFDDAPASPPRSKPAHVQRLEAWSPSRASKRPEELNAALQDDLARAEHQRMALLKARVEKNRVRHENIARAAFEVAAEREERVGAFVAAMEEREGGVEARREAMRAMERARLASRSVALGMAKAEVEERMEGEAEEKRAAIAEAAVAAEARREAMLALKAAKAGVEFNKSMTAAAVTKDSREKAAEARRVESAASLAAAEARRDEALAIKAEMAGLGFEHAKEVAQLQKTMRQLDAARILASSDAGLLQAENNRDAAAAATADRLSAHDSHSSVVRARKAERAS